ncbi:STAS domain-containing protein [Parachitinimonas caeni]|uniref:STAS domain-containing protein n=1 Tax=Parachitinimonas caeni TaxID=3031301 RepID=A0ABT7DRG4_9NEIS|nr:STAS domain-containing protein [Parachitinimonas caeni]MDK2122668.1 STAS domain-containing protein [Parachitinimonas caeni]
MQALSAIQGNKATIKLDGHFTFEGHREFKRATNEVVDNHNVTELEIDFEKVDYMDSAALGMLLLLNERMHGRSVKLINCKGTVRSVLDVANFAKIFTMV